MLPQIPFLSIVYFLNVEKSINLDFLTIEKLCFCGYFVSNNYIPVCIFYKNIYPWIVPREEAAQGAQMGKIRNFDF